MLSILIPTHNYDITALVEELYRQSQEQFIEFEIIVIEDGSKQFTEVNKSISNLKFCKYIQLTENIGRSAIRNKLADMAKYEHLLFLDCDAEICSAYFIKKYLAFCKENSVVLGGRIYSDKVLQPQYSLIIKYGSVRERNDIANQMYHQRHPMFTTPNFLITKSIFNKVRFDETILGYGHEDTIFGIMLHRLKIEFIFIDNPVIHKGLEINSKFIEKTEEALKNLHSLYLSGKYPEISSESKIISYFKRVSKYHLTQIFSLIYRLFFKVIKKQLCSPSPSLLLYDLYKLLYLCEISCKK